jgi:hypothetical protein
MLALTGLALLLVVAAAGFVVLTSVGGRDGGEADGYLSTYGSLALIVLALPLIVFLSALQDLRRHRSSGFTEGAFGGLLVGLGALLFDDLWKLLLLILAALLVAVGVAGRLVARRAAEAGSGDSSPDTHEARRKVEPMTTRTWWFWMFAAVLTALALVLMAAALVAYLLFAASTGSADRHGYVRIFSTLALIVLLLPLMLLVISAQDLWRRKRGGFGWGAAGGAGLAVVGVALPQPVGIIVPVLGVGLVALGIAGLAGTGQVSSSAE